MMKSHQPLKKIIHVDMDCFYAQVEMRDNPKLKNLPVAVGGLPGTRSVLCTSNYLARTFGVKSAMPTDYAMKLCPKLVVIPPNFNKYSKASEIIQSIFNRYSTLVEPVSLDEAYIDVSFSDNATELARQIQNDILVETGLTASVGVAPNKFLAKIASDWKKPNGFFVIHPSSVESFIKTLPVKCIPGVGKKSLEVLESLNIKTCNDINSTPLHLLILHFGKFSYDLKNYAQGIDHRDVISEWERKSLSVESTFLKDIDHENLLALELKELYLEMLERLKEHLHETPTSKIKKYFVKVRFNDFTRVSAEETLRFDDLFDLEGHSTVDRFLPLLNHCLQKKSCAVRLIGLGVRFESHEEEIKPIQLSFLPLCG